MMVTCEMQEDTNKGKSNLDSNTYSFPLHLEMFQLCLLTQLRKLFEFFKISFRLIICFLGHIKSS